MVFDSAHPYSTGFQARVPCLAGTRVFQNPCHSLGGIHDSFQLPQTTSSVSSLVAIHMSNTHLNSSLKLRSSISLSLSLSLSSVLLSLPMPLSLLPLKVSLIKTVFAESEAF